MQNPAHSRALPISKSIIYTEKLSSTPWTALSPAGHKNPGSGHTHCAPTSNTAPSALMPWPEGPFPKPLESQLPSRLLDTQQPPFRHFRCSFTPNQTLAIPSNACRTGNVTPWGLLSLHGAQPAPSSCPASNKLLCTCSYSSSNSPGCVRDTN